ncbi:MAG: aminotransferase class I/II-fold pyridoxal phosphate-dependent enzyme [Nitrospirota bacterium]|nr:MAG: aminotransferase class I/II-fold pyridoxal phosphate-dependent enzyme [Nitrospirota bacterium]
MAKPDKRIYLSPPHLGVDERHYLEEALQSNYIAPLGPQVDAFENEFAETVGVRYAAALSSGTAAVHLALRIAGVTTGDEVISQTLTFVGGVNPIKYLGASPVFIDSERSSWNMDPDLLADYLMSSSKTGRLPKAVISTDIYGQCADLDRILGICDQYEVPVISDSAEALGALYKGRHAGVGAKASVYSFNGNKILTTSGGGMLVSDDKELIDKARFLSQQARDPALYYEHSEVGFNYRMSNVLAAIGRGQLKVLNDRVSRKREIFEEYRAALSGMPGVEFMPEASYGTSTRWLTVLLIEEDKFGAGPLEIVEKLEQSNIEARPVWKPMHLQPLYKENHIVGGRVSEDLFNRGICLPSGTAMTSVDIKRVIDAIIKMHKDNING